jgi:hypothetical protein
MLGDKLAEHFSKFGIELVLVESQGLDERLVKLDEDSSPISSAFFVATGEPADRMTGIVSLGSIQFSPLWLFYRGEDLSDDKNLANYRIAVGAKGTSSQKLFKKILELHGSRYDEERYFELPYMEAEKRLQEGSIDGMFVVDTIDSPLVQGLLKNPAIHIYDYRLADAYEKLLPFLSKLTIPRGALNIKSIYPSNNIDLISTTVTLLVEENVHPVVQWIFLDAVRTISKNRQQFFADPGYFPVYLDQSFPLSEIASRYYATGLPFLAEYMPLWLAVFFDSAWFWVLATATIMIPLMSMLHASRQYYFGSISEVVYRKLNSAEQRLMRIQTRSETENLLNEIRTMELEMSEIWVSSDNLKDYYDIMSNIRQIIEKIVTRYEQFPENDI